MNLYQTVFKHYAPKGSQDGIKDFFLAEGDEQAFNWVDSEHTCDRWKEYIEELQEDDDYESEEAQIIIDRFRKEIIENKGEIDFEPEGYYLLEVGSGYDGYTRYGWKLIKQDISESEITLLRELEILNQQ
jgi:hypothetical protein